MIVAIIQSRMGSTRLPGKMLRKIGDKTLLEHVVLRATHAKTISSVVIATTDQPEDDVLASIAKKLGVVCFRGSEHDVLDRYYKAAKQYRADTVVRLTGDCPFIDPEIIDRVVNAYLKSKKKVDYVSNVHPPTFPDGMDVEVFSFSALERAWKEAKLPSEREHVTPFFYGHGLFRVKNVRDPNDNSGIRLTVDTHEDFRLVRKIYAELFTSNRSFDLKDILALLKQRPELALINGHLLRNEGYVKSIRKDSTEVYLVLGGTARKGGDRWCTTLFEHKGDLGDRLRVTAAAMLYHAKSIKPVVVVLGGRGTLPPEAPTVAKIIEEELVSLGVLKEYVVREEKSRNTFEQLYNSLPFLSDSGTMTLISNRYHLPRIRAFIHNRAELVPLKQLLLTKRLMLVGAETIVGKKDASLTAQIKDWYRSSRVSEIIKSEEKGVKEIKRGLYTST